MHSAPSVTYPVGRARVWSLTLVLVWLAGALLTGAWCVQVDSVGWRQWLAIACVLGGGVAAALDWWATSIGELHWDGGAWWWTAHAAPGEQAPVRLAVQLDLQRWLLVCMCGAAGGRCWLWLEQCREPARWGDLRRAVHARGRGAVDPAGEPLPG